MRLGDVEVGATVRLLDRTYVVTRQGAAGTTVRSTERIEREVKDRVTGRVIRKFGYLPPPKTVTSECEVEVVNLTDVAE